MSTSHTARILVVDDETEVRRLLAEALADADVEVATAATAQEAIALADRYRIDFIVADMWLGDRSGLEVLDQLNNQPGDIPSIVITGYGSAEAFAEASRRRPIELMNKPLDVDRLRQAIRQELKRRGNRQRWRWRTQRMRRVAHKINRQRKFTADKLRSTCAELTQAYELLNGKMSFQEALIDYQQDLISAGDNDDVFRSLFRLFAGRSGPVFGISLVCGSDGELRIVGRFGVPQPDGLKFCELLAWPIVETVMLTPKCMVMDLTDDAHMFDKSIRRYLAGVNVLTLPLMRSAEEVSGLVIFYRKGEQPFTEADVALVETIANPTALAIKRDD